ncbi:MAG: hypothetical protein PHT02_10430 [Tissierellia bacterium]|nr:hypothetical protein [Tissierellia bacterium]
MIDYTFTKFFLKMRHVMFINSSVCKRPVDISFYHGINEAEDQLPESILCKVKIRKQQNTLINDLTLEQDALWSCISKNFRYEIRRAEKEQVVFSFFKGREIENEMIEQFKDTYNNMFLNKGMSNKFNTKMVNKLIEDDSVVFTVAYYENCPWVFHAYIISKEDACLLYSASNLLKGKDLSSLIGRMNKCLHWKDFLLLKEMGIKRLDWGGISSITKPDGIGAFKMKFGGNPISYENLISAESLIGQVVLHIARNRLK